tara:strand:+ start:1901 stop:2974 length:1074 start_codon:yes stop_codon:yes gene_type:complete
MAYATVADASANFQATLYTGNGSTQNITNGGNSNLQPDWVWIKDRSAANDHKLTDSTRGTTYTLESNANTAQYNDTGSTTAYLTDGFSLGSNGNVNTNNNNYIAWQWKANGGTTSTNSDGSITSTVQANTAAGFSIVKWTGTDANGTVGHGLGKAPSFILFKNYTDTANWTSYHEVGPGSGTSGNVGGLYLNLENGFNTASTWYNDTSPTTSVFSVGSNSKTNSDTMIAYCFANIKGYQQAGQYYGNGNSTHGVFVNTGFRPAYVLAKRTASGGGPWAIKDYRRPGHNQVTGRLDASDNGVENVDHVFEFFANGFRVLDGGSALNFSGEQYVYYAVADQSIVSTNSLPANAGIMKAE